MINGQQLYQIHSKLFFPETHALCKWEAISTGDKLKWDVMAVEIGMHLAEVEKAEERQ